ncbi:MAG: ArnT family glycosyltransferase [Dehalococcoidia bacterium]
MIPRLFRARVRREAIFLGPVLAVAAALRLWDLGGTGQNLYYAAAAKSMSGSWHNFLFASFDPGGWLAVDKPPFGLWLQVAAARALGFHYWALALPQAVAGIAAVAVLFFICRRPYGLTVAGTAALALALMPVSVASGRNNSLDTLTMFLMLLSAGSTMRAARTGRWRWLALSAVLAGLAFNTKMFAVFVSMPAMALAYLSRGSLFSRLEAARVGAAIGVFLVVCFAWVAAVSLTPADERPYIYNSFGNNPWELTLRYNGLNRLIGSQVQSRVRATGGYTDAPVVDLNAASIAPPRGPQRLLFGRMGSQLGWFVILAFAGVMSRWATLRSARPDDLLWTAWFLTGFLVLAFAADTKETHLELIAAPVAVLAALGIRWLARNAARAPRLSLLTVAVVTLHAVWLPATVASEAWPLAVITAVLGLLVALRFLLGRNGSQARPMAVGGSLIMAAWVFAGPLYWSAATVVRPQTGSAARYPIAGPASIRDYPPATGGDLPTRARTSDPVLDLLLSQTDPDAILVLTERSLFGDAPRYIVLTGRPVLTLDSFDDQAIAATTLAELVEGGRLRYVQLPAEGPWSDPGLELGQWFQNECQDITTARLRPFDGSHLYNCEAGDPRARSP